MMSAPMAEVLVRVECATLTDQSNKSRNIWWVIFCFNFQVSRDLRQNWESDSSAKTFHLMSQISKRGPVALIQVTLKACNVLAKSRNNLLYDFIGWIRYWYR
jgi:hypothetical protein